MKTVVRNNQEEPQKDVWYAILTGDDSSSRDISSSLYDSEDKALESAMEYCDTAYIAEVKLITKVVD